MNENLKRHRPDIKVLGEGKAIAFMPEDPMGVWVHIQEVRDLLDEKDKEIEKLKEKYKDMDVTHTVHIAKMNAEIHELENMPHTDNSAVIDALETENEALKKELAELREATRWRDVEKEPPEIKEESEEVAVLVEYENNYSRGVFVTHSDFYKGDFYETHLDNEINCDYDNDGERCYQKVIKWQPMPKAPEAYK